MNVVKILKLTILSLWLSVLAPSPIAYAISCGDNVILNDQTYLAASSAERGYLYFDQNQLFRDYIADLIRKRGEKICSLKGCGKLAAEPETSLYSGGELAAVLVDSREDSNYHYTDYFRMEYPWVFSNTGYQWLGDLFWYTGHLVSVGSVLSIITTDISIPMVATGQAITLLSRPLGRISPQEITAEKGLELIRRGKPYGKIPKTSKARCPHQIFKSVRCMDLEPAISDLSIRIDRF